MKIWLKRKTEKLNFRFLQTVNVCLSLDRKFDKSASAEKKMPFGFDKQGLLLETFKLKMRKTLPGWSS